MQQNTHFTVLLDRNMENICTLTHGYHNKYVGKMHEKVKYRSSYIFNFNYRSSFSQEQIEFK